ncbi:MAG: hypothetical protein K2R98_30955 [Gemmataceae bacterium]|nr:hypothetical protein [Gemmataceae bacterium]
MKCFPIRTVLAALTLTCALLAVAPSETQAAGFEYSPTGRWMAKVDRNDGTVEYLGIELRQNGTFTFIVMNQKLQVTQETNGTYVYFNRTLTMTEYSGRRFGQYDIPTLTSNALVIGSLTYERIR